MDGKDGFQSRFRGYITSFAEYESMDISIMVFKEWKGIRIWKTRGTIRLCLVKGLEDCHTISSLDSDCPFAAILP